MVFASGLKDGRSARRNWIRRSLQAAVLVAVSGTVPEVLGGGTHIQVNNVAAGSAVFSQAGSVTTVRTGTNNTIINYEQLSLGSGDTLNFAQPSSHSRVLNRIEGNEPSVIDGTINSNGIVYLVNPAGVLFGQGAVINSAGFFAAAAHLSDGNFLGGVNHFTGASGSVMNYGVINAQQVHMVGLTVGNFGEIVAGTGGVVTMTSGDDVYIGTVDTPGSSPHVLVKVSNNTGVTKAGTGVTNSGSISAGQVSLGAGDLYAAGIYNNGSIKGAQITLNSGANTNIVAGTVDASNASGKGGTVALLGNEVGVDGTVNASGKTGGGTILVGGGLHGGGNVPTACRTYVGPTATLVVNAVSSGNGGEVVIWSEQVTRFGGSIEATGSGTGVGGYVEVSSAGSLEFTGAVNTGSTGTLLLDPSFIDVNSGGTANFTNTNQVDDFSDPDVGSGKIDPSTLAAVTTGNVLLESTGDIDFTSALTMSNAGVGVIAIAGGNIAVNNNITTKGGIISLSAGDQTPGAGGGTNPGLAAGNIAIGGHTLDTTSGTAAGANIILRAGAITLNGAANIKAGTGGAVDFYSNIATNTFTIGTATGGTISLAAADLSNVSSAAKIVIGESGNQSGLITIKQLTLTSNIPMEFNSDAGTGGVVLDNGGAGGSSAVSIGATTALTIRAGSGGILAAQAPDTHSEFTAGPVTLTSSGDIGNATNPVHPASSAGTVTASSTAGNVTLVGLGALTVGVVSGGNVSLTATGNLAATGNLTATSGDVLLTATGGTGDNISGTGNWTATGSVVLSAGGNVTNTSANISGGMANILSTGDISVAGVSATSGGLSLVSVSGNVDATGTLSAAGTLNLSAGGAIGSAGTVSVTPAAALMLSSGSGKGITVADNNALLATNLTLPTTGLTRTITLSVNGNFTVDTNVGSATDNYVISTKTGSGGNITSAAGTDVLTGKNLTLSADGAVNVSTSTNGTLLSVTTAGAGGLGNITVSEANAVNITTTTDTGSGQTIALSAPSFTANHSYGDANHNDNVSLTATSGAIDGSATSIVAHDLTLSGTAIGAGTSVKADITGNLSLTTTTGGATVVLAATDTLHTANLTLSIVNGQTTTLTAGTIVVDANVGNTLSDISFTTTTGGITGGSLISGSDIALVSKTGIGTSVASPINVNTTGTLAVTSQGVGSAGNIFIADTAALTLTAGGIPTTDAGSAQTISLSSTNAGGIEVTGNLPLGTDSLILTAADTGATVTVDAGKTVTAANVTLVADAIAITGNVTGTTGVTLAPFTSGQAITVTNTEAGFVSATSLVNVTTPTLTIGGNVATVGTNTGLITIGAGTGVDLSTGGFNLTLVAPGGVTFVNTLTLGTAKTLTFQAPGAIAGSGGTDIVIGGNGTVTFNNITGNIGSTGTPLKTEVEQIGGATGAGGIFLANSTTGTLTITGAITLTGSTGSFISDASPLVVNSPVSIAGDFSLIAGDNALATGDDLTIAANVGSSTNGQVTLQAGDNILLNSGTVSGGTVILAADHEANGDGNISQTGGTISVVTSVTASAATGISLTQANTIPSVSLTNSTSGTIALTTGGALAITTLSQTGGGAITVSAGGNVTETAAISASGSNLSVTTTGSGDDINLGTNSNNIGGGNLTMVAAGGNVSYLSSGAINVQKITTTGNATLTGTTIAQDLTDTTGIHVSLLTVSSDGAVTLTNGNNAFSTLNETDGSGGSALQFKTNASGGLTITGLSAGADSATITNTGGNISASAGLDVQNLTVSGKGGITLNSTANLIQSLSATNTTSGDITVVTSASLTLTVTQLSNTGGGATFITAGDGLVLNGTIAAGSGLTISVPQTNGLYLVNASTVITSSGPTSITADNMEIDSASTMTVTGSGVLLEPFTATTTITFNGADGAGVLGITNAELATISAVSIQIGSPSQLGDINGSGTINLPTNVTLVTAGNVDLSGVTITSSAGAALTVNHTGTLKIGTATLSGGLSETGISGAGAGGDVTLGGTVTVGSASVTFNSNVLLNGLATLTTSAAGTNFSFQAINGVTPFGSLSITAGTGTVTFNSGVGTTAVIGGLQVVSSGAINLGGDVETAGGFVGLTSAGALTLVGGNRIIDTTNAGGIFPSNNIQLAAAVTGGGHSLTLTAGGSNGNISVTSFTSTGNFVASGKQFTNSGTISADVISITNARPTTINGDLTATGNLTVDGTASAFSTFTDASHALSGSNVTITQSGAISIGGTITSNANVTLTSTGSSVSATGLVSGAGTIAYSALTTVGTGNITDTSGPFTSSGTDFTNSGDVSAVGITITNTGVDTFSGKLAAGTGNLSVTGGASIGDTSSALSGGNVTLSASGIVSVGGTITATNNVGVTSTGASISTTGLVSGSGTIAYSASTTVAVGNVTSTGPGGLFSSSGTDFTNSGDVSAVGITITNTGVDTFNGKLIAGSGNLSVTGAGSIADTSSNLSGGNITLSASGLVSVGGNLTATNNVGVTSTGSSISTTGIVGGAGTITYSAALNVTVGNVTSSGGLFSSSGLAFTNSGNVSAVGTTITNTGIDTFNGPLAAGTGALSVTGAGSIADASSALSGAGVTLHATASIVVGSTITSTGIVSVVSSLSTVQVSGNISGAGDTTLSALGSSTTSGISTSAGNVSITASQANLNGNVTATAGNVSVNGPAVLSGTPNVTGNVVTFTAGITGSGTTLVVSGNQVSFGGNIGANGSALTALTVTATGAGPTTTFGAGATGVFAGTQTYGSAVTLNNNFTFTGNTFTFSKSLNPTGATSLTIAGSETGTATFDGPAIGTVGTPFSAITISDVTGATITGSMVATGGISIDHAGTHVPVTLTGSITSTANAVSIPGALTLGAAATSTISADAAAGTVGITLGNVTGATTSNLTLISNGSGNLSSVTIIVGQMGTSGARVGDIDIQSAAATDLGGNIFAHNMTLEDNLGGTPGVNPASVPTIATAFHVGANLTINLSGNFTMEQNQKLSVYGTTAGSGSLDIDTSAGNGLITVGDLSALASITLDTGNANNPIHIINRPGAKDIQQNGTLSAQADNGTDIVSGVAGNGGLMIRGTVLVIQPAGLSTTNSFVSLATGNPANDLTFGNGFKVDGGNLSGILKEVPQVPPAPAVTLGNFTFISGLNSTSLDIMARGVPQDIANLQGTVIPQDVATLTPERGETISGALRDALNELGIYARDLRTDEIIAYLVGRALYDDVPYKLEPDPTDNKIATNRLPYSPVLPMVEAYEKLFFKFEKGSDGKTHKVPQDKAISNAIGLAWVTYSSQLHEKATGDHFRGYLEANVKTNPKLAAALDDINQLRDLLVQIKNLGLTENEFNVAQSALLKRVRPANIKEADFLAAVMGPSTLTHGQTAMR